MQRLSSRKLALVIAGILAIVGVAVIKATWGLDEPGLYIAAIVALSGGGALTQAYLDAK